MKPLTKKLAEEIRRQVGFFNGWSVSDETEWQACVKAARSVIRIMRSNTRVQATASPKAGRRKQKSKTARRA